MIKQIKKFESQDVNWACMRRSEDVQDVLFTFNLGPVSR